VWTTCDVFRSNTGKTNGTYGVEFRLQVIAVSQANRLVGGYTA
jgi:hypothetical protein